MDRQDRGEQREAPYDQMEELIRELAEESRYERISLGNDRELLRSSTGEEFFLRAITHPDDPAVEKMFAFMQEQFDEEEVTPLSWIRYSITEKLYSYHIVEDARGEIVSYSNTQYLELSPSEESVHGTTESILAVWYVNTKPAARGKGFARELYQSVYTNGLREARSRGQVIKGIIGEAVGSVELFLNHMGRKRIYFEDDAGHIHQVPYVQPPTDFDTATGEPIGETLQEQIMLRLIDGRNELAPEELLLMVEAMYQAYVAEEQNYDSRKAFENAREFSGHLLEELKQTLSKAKDGKLFLLSAEERETQKVELSRKDKAFFEIEESEEDGE